MWTKAETEAPGLGCGGGRRTDAGSVAGEAAAEQSDPHRGSLRGPGPGPAPQEARALPQAALASLGTMRAAVADHRLKGKREEADLRVREAAVITIQLSR